LELQNKSRSLFGINFKKVFFFFRGGGVKFKILEMKQSLKDLNIS